MPTDSYFYLTRKLEKCMMSNFRGSFSTQNNLCGLVTTQKINTEMAWDEYVNKTVSSMDKSKSKITNKVDTSVVDLNKMNTGKVKYAKDEEPLVMDNSNIKVLGYFKLFKCSKSVFNTLEATYKRACREIAIKNYRSCDLQTVMFVLKVAHGLSE